MKRMNVVVLLMAVFAFSLLAGCAMTMFPTGEDLSWYGGPPPIRAAAPLELVVIPGTRVYFVPGLSFDIFFYNDYWWSPRGNHWYGSKAYNGPWGIVEQRYVPAPVHRVPNDYWIRYEKEKRIPYGQWKKQWNENKKDNRPGRGNN